MKETKSKAKLSELVEDFDLYPRQSVDSTNVRAIREAIESGMVVPPIVVETETLRIVDGVHRRRAHQQLLDADAEVEVLMVKYDNEAELFAHAVQLNATHGKRLSAWDRLRCIELSRKKGLAWSSLAAALGTTESSLDKLEKDRTGYNREGRVVPLKRAARHMRGETLTDEQEVAQRKLGGNEARFYFQQITLLIESDLLPREPTIVGVAQRAAQALSGWLGDVSGDLSSG